MVVVAHQVVRSENGLQNQVVFDLGPAIPLAHGDVELVSGRARRVEPEVVVAVAAGVARNAPIDGDVVLGPIVEVPEVQTHLVCADVQQLRVPHPRAALIGLYPYRVEDAGVRAGRRVRLVHAVHVHPVVGAGVVPGGIGDPYVDHPPYLHVAGHRLVELEGPVDRLIAAGGVPLLVLVVGQEPVTEDEPLESVLVTDLQGGNVPHHVVGAVGQVLVPTPLIALVGLELQLGIDAWRDVERVDLRVGVVQGQVPGAVLYLVQVCVDVDVAVPVRELEGPVDVAPTGGEISIAVLVVECLRDDRPVELVVRPGPQVGEVPLHLVGASPEGVPNQLPGSAAVLLHQLEQGFARAG